jgi:hypothetical protein
MENPIIACDVSKGSSHIQGFIGLSNPIGSPFVVRHLKCDLKLIKDLAKDLEKQTKKKPIFIFEYTGVYHECIVNYAKRIMVSTILLQGKVINFCDLLFILRLIKCCKEISIIKLQDSTLKRKAAAFLTR